MERLIKMGLLYDFYAPLLTEKQRQVAEEYYFHNLSLGEIAEEEKISRQAVHDLLHRTEELLLKYEERLGLCRSYCERRKVRDRLAGGLSRLGQLLPDQMVEAKELLQDLEATLKSLVAKDEGQEDLE